MKMKLLGGDQMCRCGNEGKAIWVPFKNSSEIRTF